MTPEELLAYDAKHVWHPYSSMSNPQAMLSVESADGVYLQLTDGRRLIDGMSSWWSALHGYNHPVLNQALIDQSQKMSHIMFGGLTHEPAVTLAKKLIDISSENLQYVFFADSGSVAVEVAIKMAFQYWSAKEHTAKTENKKTRLLTVHNGYYGDTFGAMAACDPINGMHGKFNNVLAKHIFAAAPKTIDTPWKDEYIHDFKQKISEHHSEIAAVIIEPMVQNAGGLRFYHADFLQQVRQLCDEYDVLLILDEIATGFGRTGTLFAYEQANVQADILVVGKALTGGYMTLAAVLTSAKIVNGIEADGQGVLMHGPTFMANPLACSVANASIDLLLKSNWQENVSAIEHQLKQGLSPCKQLNCVKDIRIKGAIGVIELYQEIDTSWSQPLFTEAGVWLRPFGKLVYLMPPFIINENQLKHLMSAIFDVLKKLDLKLDC